MDFIKYFVLLFIVASAQVDSDDSKASNLDTLFFTLPLTNIPVLVFVKTIDSFDDGESFGADVGGFSGLMKTANITICFKSGATLASEYIMIAKSFYFIIPKNSIGKLFEVYASTNDINPGSMMVSFRQTTIPTTTTTTPPTTTTTPPTTTTTPPTTTTTPPTTTTTKPTTTPPTTTTTPPTTTTTQPTTTTTKPTTTPPTTTTTPPTTTTTPPTTTTTPPTTTTTKPTTTPPTTTTTPPTTTTTQPTTTTRTNIPIWPNISLIMNAAETISLVKMTKSSNGILLYRATRDGFEASAFHTKCDGKANTLTIIKTNSNYVFGGYSSAKWGSLGDFANDSSAFIFTLRRNGVSNSDRFMSKYNMEQYSIYGISKFGPTFGGGHDINIIDKSNINNGSYTNLGHTYYPPNGYSYGSGAKSFLAGNYDQWTTTEIEVFQITVESISIEPNGIMRSSLILNAAETISLVQMTKSLNETLLYRATRDGFEARSFHLKCDGKANTVSIIKTNGNYVFGGYTAGKWNSNYAYVNDASAFLFSLRRNSVSYSNKLMINSTMAAYAIDGLSTAGPMFGNGNDIIIGDKSNIYTGSRTFFCWSYQCPSGYTFGNTSQSFLAGTYNGWLTTEIEVYQIQ